VFLGTDTGAFALVGGASVGPGFGRIVAADVDGSGAPDLVTTNPGAATLSILVNGGGGFFGVQPPIGTAAGPLGVEVADFDGDGLRDLVVACQGASSVQTFRATAFLTYAAPTSYAVGSGPDSVVTGAFDAGASLDVAATLPADQDLYVLLQD
jgi:hypothetical protein